MDHQMVLLWCWCSVCIWCSVEGKKTPTRAEALETLREVFDLPRAEAPLEVEEERVGRRRRAHRPPPFIRALYEAVASDPRIPLRGHVVRSYRETIENATGAIFFDLFGLTAGDHVVEAELHLHRANAAMAPDSTPGDDNNHHHHANGTPPYYLVRVYQRLSRLDLSAFPIDSHRLLAVQHVAAAIMAASPSARGWHVVNVRAAVQDWLSARRPNLGFLVHVVTGAGQPASQKVTFDRRAAGGPQKSKEPALVVLTSRGPLKSEAAQKRAQSVLRRRWRSVIEGIAERGPEMSATPVGKAGNSSGCALQDLVVDFRALRLTNWIAAPKSFNSGQCVGSCTMRPLDGAEITSHAALLGALRRLGRPRSAPAPTCTPAALAPLTLLACHPWHGHCALRVLEDMVAERCGCH